MPDETPADRQKRVWDKSAPSYDRQIAFFEKIQFGGGREWLCERAHGRVLEVAVGTGRDLPHYPADATLTAIELSPAMLAIARRRAADLGRDVDFHEGDAEHLPFADASFDTVLCALSLCTIPGPAAAIGEMKRVLVPGGRLLLLDHIGSTWPPVYAAQWLVERLTIRAAGEHFTRRQLPIVQAAGFQVAETERLKAGTVERIHAVKPARGLPIGGDHWNRPHRAMPGFRSRGPAAMPSGPRPAAWFATVHVDEALYDFGIAAGQ